MSSALAYDEILDFLAAGSNADSIAQFRPSEAAKARVTDLIERKEDGVLSDDEAQELEDYIQLEHLMVMVKARAQLKLRS
jgi:hypothetical protein